MTLVDTPAWIEFFRIKGDPNFKKRVALLVRSGSAAYTCPIYFELLLGARASEEAYIKAILAESTRIYFVDKHWEMASRLGRQMRSAGVTVPINDLFVATVSVSDRVRLLCKDEHFSMMKRVMGNQLRLERAP